MMSSQPRLSPMLSYRDAPAAIDFLVRAFGFEEHSRMEMSDGRIGHAELGMEGVRIMLASEYPELGLESPLDAETRYSQLYVIVDDVDAHFERAREAGAVIAAEPVDEHGARFYRVSDPEGHRWLFATPQAG